MFAGLFENFDPQAGLSSPMGQLGLELIAAHGTPKTQGLPGIRNVAANIQDQQQRQREEQQQAQARSMTYKLLMDRNHPELAAMVQAGAMDGKSAFNAMVAMEKQNQPDPTAMMKEYEWARQNGFKGSPMDFIAARKTGTNVNVNMPSAPQIGTIPQGWAAQQDETGAWSMQPIEGGPAAQEIEAAEQARENAKGQTARYGNIVLQDIGRARELIEGAPWYAPTTGFLGNILKDVGGTAAADVQQLTNTVRANIGFDRLQAMREASPTGGALGQVTERELAFLQATLGSLEQAQSEEQLLFNLDRLNTIYSDILRKASAYPNAQQYGFGPAETSQSTSDIDALIDQYAD